MAQLTDSQVLELYYKNGGDKSGASLEEVIDDLQKSGITIVPDDTKLLKHEGVSFGEKLWDSPFVQGLRGTELASPTAGEKVQHLAGDVAPSIAGAMVGGPAGAIVGRAAQLGGREILAAINPKLAQAGTPIKNTVDLAMTYGSEYANTKYVNPSISMGINKFGGGIKDIYSSIASKFSGLHKKEIALAWKNPRVINDPAIGEAADDAFSQALKSEKGPNLTPADDSISMKAGVEGMAKQVPTSSDYSKTIDLAAKELSAEYSDPQVLYDGVRAINYMTTNQELSKTMSRNIFKRLYKLKDGLLSRLDDYGYDIAGANEKWRQGAVQKNFKSWMPLTKFGAENKLGTVVAGAAGIDAAANLFKGNKKAAARDVAVMSLFSPRLVGMQILAAKALTLAAEKAGKPINALGPQVAKKAIQDYLFSLKKDKSDEKTK